MHFNLFSFLLLFFFSYVLLPAQTVKPLIIKGKVKEHGIGSSLPGVNVYLLDDPTIGTVSDAEGFFNLEVKALPVKIVCSFIGYLSDTLTIRAPLRNFYSIELKPDIFLLPKIEVTAKLELERLTSKYFSVKDFLVLDDRILFLKKHGDIWGYILVLATLEGTTLDTFSLKKRYIQGPDFLHQSCLGNIHLVTYTEAFQFNLDNDKIELKDRYGRGKYERLVLPCIANIEDYFYLKSTLHKGLTTEFKIADRHGTFRRSFKMVSDKSQIRKYREDAFYTAVSQDLEERRAFEMTDEEQKQLRNFQQDLDFRNRFFYKGLDIPLLVLKDSLAIFNYYENKVEFFDKEGLPDTSKTIAIDFHLNHQWEEVLMDEKTQNIYALFNSSKGKYIAALDLTTGECQIPLHFECIFIRKLVIHGDFMYLLHGNTHERNWTLHKVKF